MAVGIVAVLTLALRARAQATGGREASACGAITESLRLQVHSAVPTNVVTLCASSDAPKTPPETEIAVCACNLRTADVS
jgi:hypothetical protein